MSGRGPACGPSLSGLPPEIFRKVFPYLAGTPSIQAVVKTCTTFYHLEIPGQRHPVYRRGALQDYRAQKLTVGMECLTGMLAAEPENNENRHMPLELESSLRLDDCLLEYLKYLKVHSCGAAVYDQASELFRTVEQCRHYKHLTEI